MDFFDLINELRKGKPDIQKAAKAMKILGWVCIGGGIWNFAIYYLAPFNKSPFNLPSQYPYLALISLVFIGTLFFRSAAGIKEMESSGKKLGQVAIALLTVIFFGFMLYVFPFTAIPIHDKTFSAFFIIFLVIAFAQIAVPAFFGIRYIGRLPVKEDGYQYKTEGITRPMGRPGIPENQQTSKYKDSPVPFGLFGTFALIIAVPLISVLIAEILSEKIFYRTYLCQRSC